MYLLCFIWAGNQRGKRFSVGELFIKKIFCRHRLDSGAFCNTVVAATDGSRLFFDGEPVKNNPRFVGFDCPNCRQTVKWRQSVKREKAEY
jgi:hypothetical protein